MGTRKWAARVGACLHGSPGKQSICGTFFSLLWGGGGFFHIEGLFSFFCAGGGGFFSLCAEFFGAHALVARVIANMLHWSNLRQMVIHNLLISNNTFWSTFRITCI